MRSSGSIIHFIGVHHRGLSIGRRRRRFESVKKRPRSAAARGENRAREPFQTNIIYRSTMAHKHIRACVKWECTYNHTRPRTQNADWKETADGRRRDGPAVGDGEGGDGGEEDVRFTGIYIYSWRSRKKTIYVPRVWIRSRLGHGILKVSDKSSTDVAHTTRL